MPTVSVIIPNYNHGRFLRQRVESVLAQTRADFEVLLMDDASTDDSRAVIDGFRGHPQVRVLCNDKNSGCVFAQWNRGLAATTGKYVWIAESDDFAAPRFLETLVAILEAQPWVVLAHCRVESVDAAGRPTEDAKTFYADARWDTAFLMPGGEEIRSHLINRNTIPNASAVVFRRWAADQAGPADTSFRLTGDWKFWISLLQQGDLAYMSEPLSSYRFHVGSVRSDSDRTLLSYVESVRIRAHVRTLLPDTHSEQARIKTDLRTFLRWLSKPGLPFTPEQRNFWKDEITASAPDLGVHRRLWDGISMVRKTFHHKTAGA